MNNNNKIWVFQSSRNLTENEESQIKNTLSIFLKSWAAHGAKLKSELKIINHKFIIIEVDENFEKASGCSIDSLNQCIRKIDTEFNLNLLNRLWVSYESEIGNIETIPLNDFKEKVKSSIISPNSIIYNLSVSNLDEFNKNFKVPLKESWAKIHM